jgi:hypothetical protein
VHQLAKHHGIQQRRTYVKEVKNCRLSIRHFRHVKKRAKAKKALTRLRTIANKLIRELQRKLSTHSILIFSSETTGPIATKLWWNGPWMAPFQNCFR